MELRPYQQACVNAIWNHIANRNDNPVAVLPTGGGKTFLIAQLAKDVIGYGGKMIYISHVRELIQQTQKHLEKLAPEITFGIYSAGLKSRDVGYQVTLAGIQSVADKAELLGPADIIFVDEVHRVPQDGDGQYQTFLKKAKEVNPNVRLIGLTATPFRLSSGLICKPDGLFNSICYEVSLQDLIRDKWLCPLISKAGKEKPDLSNVRIRAGEFIESEMEHAFLSNEQKAVMACYEIAEKTQDRKSVLIFCSGIKHVEFVVNCFRDLNVGRVEYVIGSTPEEERDSFIKDFRDGKIKYLVNCETLTTGFDAPNVDCVALLRATMSPGLLMQMMGRAFRNAPEKTNALILDFGQNLKRHGPVDRITPPKGGKESKFATQPGWKECYNCGEIVLVSCEICPACEQKLDREGRAWTHDSQSDDSSDAISREEYEVLQVHYWKHHKKHAPPEHPSTMWVEYDCGLMKASEFVCFEHQGFALQKAMGWWKQRSNQPFPKDVTSALISIDAYGIKEPKKIRVEADGKYLRIKRAWDFVDAKPVVNTQSGNEEFGDDISNPF